VLLLHVDQNGFVPMECIVSARALSGTQRANQFPGYSLLIAYLLIFYSGKIESRALATAELNVVDYVVDVGTKLNTTLGPKSTFQGTLNRASNQLGKTDNVSMSKEFPPIDYPQTRVGQSINLLERSPKKNHFSDPTATVLSSTFRSADLNTVLDNVIQGTMLLKQKEKKGGAQNNEPPIPMGPGSGAVFDAGSQWVDALHQKKFKKKQKKRAQEAAAGTGVGLTGTSVGPDGLVPAVSEDRIIDGYRIPPTLDSTTAVNFVLTQERGKLKPKDLKAAIEKNRFVVNLYVYMVIRIYCS
jgi:hypothetical protein